jgi:hypothetical protein
LRPAHFALSYHFHQLIVLIYQVARFNFPHITLFVPVMHAFEKPHFSGRGKNYPANMTISRQTLARLAGANIADN